MTPTPWMVESRRARGGRKTWAVYRLRDRDKPDVIENREYRGRETPRRELAAALAEALNEQGERA